jgi:hypothetical protein
MSNGDRFVFRILTPLTKAMVRFTDINAGKTINNANLMIE